MIFKLIYIARKSNQTKRKTESKPYPLLHTHSHTLSLSVSLPDIYAVITLIQNYPVIVILVLTLMNLN